MTIKWGDGTYTFDHNNAKSTTQINNDCDNITDEINEIFKELENYE